MSASINSSFLQKLLLALYGEARVVVPIFIHNPVSQAIEAVVMTSLDQAIAATLSPTGAATDQTAAADQTGVGSTLNKQPTTQTTGAAQKSTLNPSPLTGSTGFAGSVSIGQ